MWKLIKYIALSIVCILLGLYVLYRCEEKSLFNNDMHQLEFNYLLLEELHQGKNNQAATLLSADIQRVLVNISAKNTIRDTNKLCYYMNKDNINLLKEYDNNISIEYINKIITYCENLSPLSHSTLQ